MATGTALQPVNIIKNIVIRKLNQGGFITPCCYVNNAMLFQSCHPIDEKAMGYSQYYIKNRLGVKSVSVK